MGSPVVVQAAVEGDVDAAVLQRLVTELGGSLGTVYGRRGKDHLLRGLSGFNRAATYAPWVVLIDLDNDAACAPAALVTWLPQPADNMYCRVVVRAVESWLMADRPGVARFLGISETRVPRDPDAVANPKQQMVQLAVASRRRSIRKAMVPRQGSGRLVGPDYTSQMIDFVTNHWNPVVAIESSDSLRRCRTRLISLLMYEML